MPDKLILFQTILESLRGLLSGDASTTTYIILALIPVCMAVAVREIWCWFFKQNKLVSKMERVERQLIKTNQLLELIGQVLEEQKSTPVTPVTSPLTNNAKEFIPTTPKNYDKPKDQGDIENRVEPKSLGDRKFSL